MMEERNMSWIRKIATATSTLAILGGGVLATASPASAVGGCASGYLCVYDRTDFGGAKIVSRSTNSCFTIVGTHPDWVGRVESYVNNLPVNAHLWEHDSPNGWVKIRTFVSGGFSSSIPVNYGDVICQGSAAPGS
ncbi:peptidase inhibitor family I36 protein [Streptomyces niveus]|uniref:peptidase inhibitor family I36 protein n=1 Tax=Streptomyces niveus TaxID=193462 RepID=UPI0036C14448